MRPAQNPVTHRSTNQCCGSHPAPSTSDSPTVKLRRWGPRRNGRTPAEVVRERTALSRSADWAKSPVISQQEIVMTLKSNMKVQVAVAAAIGVLSIGSALAGGDTLKSGDVDTMGQWYGNAGGLQGSDRVMVLGKATSGGKDVGITFDKDVAQRTNMQRDSATNGTAGIAYDKDVAERTNLPRGQKSAPIHEAGVTNK
jgi:hypothetical protein